MCPYEVEARNEEPGSIVRRIRRQPLVECDLRELFADLILGYLRIDSRFSNPAEHVFNLRSAERRQAMPERQRFILERALLGTSQKVIASELGVATSTVSVLLKSSLDYLGLRCRASGVPMLLVMCAHAYASTDAAERRLSASLDPVARQIVVRVDRPERDLELLLPPAEFDAVQLLVEGKSYAEIAAIRRTSQRTIANQLASACRRLNVSGRAQLLSRLAKPDHVDGPTLPPTPASQAKRLHPNAGVLAAMA